MEKYCRAAQAIDDKLIRRILFVCRITKATDTHSEYVILISFARQQWSRERDTMLHYSYCACLVRVVASVTKPDRISLFSDNTLEFVLQLRKTMENLNLCSGMVLQANRRVDLAASWEVLLGPVSVGPLLRHR